MVLYKNSGDKNNTSYTQTHTCTLATDMFLITMFDIQSTAYTPSEDFLTLLQILLCFLVLSGHAEVRQQDASSTAWAASTRRHSDT